MEAPLEFRLNSSVDRQCYLSLAFGLVRGVFARGELSLFVPWVRVSMFEVCDGKPVIMCMCPW